MKLAKAVVVEDADNALKCCAPITLAGPAKEVELG
jgi:hypothetical protein